MMMTTAVATPPTSSRRHAEVTEESVVTEESEVEEPRPSQWNRAVEVAEADVTERSRTPRRAVPRTTEA